MLRMVWIKVIVQLIVGFLIGFTATLTVNLATTYEVIIFTLGNIVGVTGGGTCVEDIQNRLTFKGFLLRLLFTGLGGALGALLTIVILRIHPADDFSLPLVASILGYYSSNFLVEKAQP